MTIMKHDCYVFDFALDRALHQIADYACQLNSKDSDPEANVGEFISFLPVLAYDGAKMTAVTAEDILDFTTAGTSATLLAKRWESALLVNVDNETLKRLMDSKEAMDALGRIEGFRSLNSDLETIINRSEAIKKAKKDRPDMPAKERRELDEEEKKLKSKRKEIQDKLIKFATRIPVFMYLSEYRERCLKDVITLLEPKLFRLTTGLSVKDFELLCSLNIFNGEVMNQAIWQFKRYEDASLEYMGVNRHEDEENVGGWDTVIRREEFEALFQRQQESKTSILRAVMPSPDPSETVQTVVKKQPAVSSEPNTAIAPTPKQSKAFTTKTDFSKTASPSVSHTGIQTPVAKVIDVSGVSIGTKIRHKTFGTGTVVRFDKAKKYIYIDFGGGKEKQFGFPNAFESGFLVQE